MKRFIPFRLVIAVPVLLMGAALLALFMSPLSKSAAEKGASLALATEVRFSSFSISPFTGNLNFKGLTVQDKENPEENLLTAKEGRGDLSLYELLRGRAVVQELSLASVRCHVKRKEDGSFNVEDLGKKEEEIPPATEEEEEKAKKTDWLETIERVVKKLEKWLEKSRREEKKREERKAPRPVPPEEIPTGRARYVDRYEPSLVIKKISIEDLQIELEDQTKEKNPPSIKEATAEVRNLSSNPRAQNEPLSFSLRGKVGEAGLTALGGRLDVRFDKEALMALKAEGKQLNLKALEPLFGFNLPVQIKEGKSNFETSFSLRDFSSLHLEPFLDINNLAIAPKPEREKLVGIPAGDFCEAVNYAKGLSIDGLSISGTFSKPEFNWSAEFHRNLRKLLEEAGKSYLAEQVEKRLGKAASGLKKKAEEELGKGAGDKIESGMGKKAEEATKDILNEGLDLFK